jgi:hypothetical protein
MLQHCGETLRARRNSYARAKRAHTVAAHASTTGVKRSPTFVTADMGVKRSPTFVTPDVGVKRSPTFVTPIVSGSISSGDGVE